MVYLFLITGVRQCPVRMVRLQRLKAKSRSLDTAQKVIVGAALLAKVRKPEEVQLRAWLLQFLKAEVTRQADVTRILPLINELEALPGQ